MNYKKLKLMFFCPGGLCFIHCLSFEKSPLIISLALMFGKWNFSELLCQIQVWEGSDIDKIWGDVNIYPKT